MLRTIQGDVLLKIETLYDEITSAEKGIFYEINTPTTKVFNAIGTPDVKITVNCSDSMLNIWQNIILSIALPEIYVPTVEKELKDKYPHIMQELIKNTFGGAKKFVWRKFKSNIIAYCERKISRCNGKITIDKAKTTVRTVISDNRQLNKPAYKNKAVVSSIALLISYAINITTQLNTSQLNTILIILTIILAYLEHKSVNDVIQELGL